MHITGAEAARRMEVATFTITVPDDILARLRRGESLIIRDILGLPERNGEVRVIAESSLQDIAVNLLAD